MILILAGLVASFYFAWANSRISIGMYYDPAVPLAFVYPDAWLVELNDWYDKLHPIPPGTIKKYGEIDRVKQMVLILRIASAGVLFLGIASYLWSGRKTKIDSKPGVCAACGYDLRGNADSKECPECGENRELMDR